MEEEFGIDRVTDPERFALFIDHMVPAVAPHEEELHKIPVTGGEKTVPVREDGMGHQWRLAGGNASCFCGAF